MTTRINTASSPTDWPHLPTFPLVALHSVTHPARGKQFRGNPGVFGKPEQPLQEMIWGANDCADLPWQAAPPTACPDR